MTGIYIHIPFCRKACYYCNFHFSTSLRRKDEFIAALLKEIELQRDYLVEPVESIYFGGGTPSILSTNDIELIMQTVLQNYQLAGEREVTLEANPNDMELSKVARWKQLGINRLSIGIQSFRDKDLQYLARTHDGKEALQAIEIAQKAGFNNLTVDLIYGIPTLSNQDWFSNLQTVLALGIPHISAYNLTVEPRTALDALIKKNKRQEPEEERGARQFEILMEVMKAQGYLHYEISNFCRRNMFSRHNCGYWQGKHYLGLGPSAHSYQGQTRQWNIAHNGKYIEALQQGKVPAEMEILDPKQKWNEYIFTSLRTMWGCDLTYLREHPASYYNEFWTQARKYLQKGLLRQDENALILTDKGRLIADYIIADLFTE